jgi:hypothetical protein
MGHLTASGRSTHVAHSTRTCPRLCAPQLRSRRCSYRAPRGAAASSSRKLPSPQGAPGPARLLRHKPYAKQCICIYVYVYVYVYASHMPLGTPPPQSCSEPHGWAKANSGSVAPGPARAYATPAGQHPCARPLPAPAHFARSLQHPSIVTTYLYELRPLDETEAGEQVTVEAAIYICGYISAYISADIYAHICRR